MTLESRDQQNLTAKLSGTVRCTIAAPVKRRNGKPKYWCSTHRSPAWGPEGEQLAECPKARDETAPDHQTLIVDLTAFAGGVAIWGALPAIYDTYGGRFDSGIHVHARREPGGRKVIDRTYKRVLVKDTESLLGGEIEISEPAAVSFVASAIFGVPLKYLKCSHCGAVHHDDDFFAVNLHKKHLCGSCGREFFDVEPSVSNPIMLVKEQLNDPVDREVISPQRPLRISQADVPRGIQIWASNQAVIWTSSVREESGIHVHGYDRNGRRIVDDTFDIVEIDGIILNDVEARYYMAQMSLPHLSGRVVALTCPTCKQPHFDRDTPTTPSASHTCKWCGVRFDSPGKAKVVSNPFVDTLEALRAAAKS